jgi:putative nucleotidyltransferase with HDIG domain
MYNLLEFEKEFTTKIIKSLWLAICLGIIIGAIVTATSYTIGTWWQLFGMAASGMLSVFIISLLHRYKIARQHMKYLVNIILIFMVSAIVAIMRNPEMFSLFYTIMAINLFYRDRVLHIGSSIIQVAVYLIIALFVPEVLPSPTFEDSTFSLTITKITLFFMVVVLIDVLNHFTDQIWTKLVKKEKEGFLLALTDSVGALVQALEAKDVYTNGHSQRTSLYANVLAKQLMVNIPEDIFLNACLLHDIGKIGIPDRVLSKKGKLTTQEMALVKTHTEVGASILKNSQSLAKTIPMVLYHHERFDGQGYPHGLPGESIPLEARILSVADSFDAMTSSRPYRKTMSPAKAYEEIISQSGAQFCPKVVEAFVNCYNQILVKYTETH